MTARVEKSDFRLMAAPLQGLTEAPFRHFHATLFPMSEGETVTYFTPFVRIEKGEPRARDIRDVASPMNASLNIVPQIIARDGDEFAHLVEAVVAQGYKEVNLNAGCPFPPQVNRGRGAGLMDNPHALEEIACRMAELHGMRGIHFSLKMRLGVESAEGWRKCVSIINSMPLDYIAIHPRTARQQYSGELRLDILGEFIAQVHNSVIFNGEILSPEDITTVRGSFPDLRGVMVGRGLLRRPSLFIEYLSGIEWSETDRCRSLLRIHSSICNHYISTLCGEVQILTKLKPFWEYFGLSFPHKQVKTVLKSRTLSTYLSAVEALG